MALQPQSRSLSESGWSKLSDLEILIEIIRQMSLKDALLYLTVSERIINYSKAGYARVKGMIVEKANKEKFAFVPDKKEVDLLKSFVNNSNYVVINTLVPRYRYIDVIRSGILIDYYLKNPTTENSARNQNIKTEIKERPNGLKLSKLIRLPSTPFFEMLLKYMLSLKEQGYSEENLEERFEEIVDGWEQSTKMVRSSAKIESIVNYIKRNIDDGKEIFILCGMKTASEKVEEALKQVNDEKYLSENKYSYQLSKTEEGVTPRTQLMFFKIDS